MATSDGTVQAPATPFRQRCMSASIGLAPDARETCVSQRHYSTSSHASSQASSQASSSSTVQGARYDHQAPTPVSTMELAVAAPSSVEVVQAKPIRRRMRMITSCFECRRRKLKCNKSQPCWNCVRFGRECHYLSPKLDEAGQLRLTGFKEKVGSLERQLEREVAQPGSRGYYGHGMLADEVEDGFDNDGELECTPMVSLDLAYEDADTDLIIDLGIQIGRMRLTERIGGLNRPRLAEEIEAGLNSSPVNGLFDYIDLHAADAGYDVMMPDYLKPSSAYIAPSSGTFFGGAFTSLPLSDYLIDRPSGDRLLKRYFEAVHPIARCVHRPTLEYDYQCFWDDMHHGWEPRASMQAIVFAAWLSAVVSLDEATAMNEYGWDLSNLISHMKLATEASLGKANFLRTTRFETMQAFVMYLIPLCRAEVSRAHSVLVGAAVRMAECMGLHRDGDNYGLTPLETHMRRLVWHQLCFLDIRTCEAQGPKPAIRRDDYDTSLPLNCEEDQIKEGVAADTWTSTLLSVVRFQINEMMRTIWFDRRKLEQRKTTLTAVMKKIENFRKHMFERYDRFLDERVPMQRYTKLVMNLLMYRLHAMVLHPYHANTTNPMPRALNDLLIKAGVWILELSVQLETHADFAAWSWYIGAYQQFQIALLLATELYYRPDNPQADRIWPCLDYVFTLDPQMPRNQKAPHILSTIMARTKFYATMRKIRAPTILSRAVPDRVAVKTDPVKPQQQQQQQQKQQQQQQQLPLRLPLPAIPPPPPPSELKTDQTHNNNNNNMLITRAPAPLPVTMPMPMPVTLSASNMVPAATAPPPQQLPLPMQNVVFAGVSNGEALWGLPPGNNPDSPEGGSSDGGSVVGMNPNPHHHHQHHHQAVARVGAAELFDWEALSTILTQNPQSGEFEFANFLNPLNVNNPNGWT